MAKAGVDPTVFAGAASLRAWLNANAGTDPSVDHMTAALTTRARWSSSPKQPGEASIGNQVRAVCLALFEFCRGEERAVTEQGVGRLRQLDRKLRALLREFKDVSESAMARREAYAAIARLYGPRANAKAAAAFAFGPPEAYAELEDCS